MVMAEEQKLEGMEMFRAMLGSDIEFKCIAIGIILQKAWQLAAFQSIEEERRIVFREQIEQYIGQKFPGTEDVLTREQAEALINGFGSTWGVRLFFNWINLDK
jgi:hypothetical protein